MAESLEQALLDAFESWAHGALDDRGRVLYAYPMSVLAGENSPEDWPTDKKLARREGKVVTVWANRVQWCASVIASPKGNSITVVVPRGATVIEVESRNRWRHR